MQRGKRSGGARLTCGKRRKTVHSWENSFSKNLAERHLTSPTGAEAQARASASAIRMGAAMSTNTAAGGAKQQMETVQR